MRKSKRLEPKTVLREIGRFSVVLFAMVLAGYILLVMTYTIPEDSIAEHVKASSGLFETEGESQFLIPGNSGSKLDNFTDALMLLTAAYNGTDSVWQEAANASRISIGDYSPVDTLLAWSSGEDLDYYAQPYARYWHGYLVFLKPLLAVFNYAEIRNILVLLHSVLLFSVLYLLGRKDKRTYFLPTLMAVFLLNPAVCSLSLQYTTIYFLTFLQLSVIMIREKDYCQNSEIWLYHFFIVGCLTSYFDLLTYPLVTFGIPITFMIAQYSSDMRDGFRKLIGCGGVWGCGYGAMWVSKWVLASVITGNNVLAQAGDSIAFRTATEYNDTTFSILDVIIKNIKPCAMALGITAVIAAWKIVTAAIRGKINNDFRILPVVLIIGLPFEWYSVLSNHSWIHFWMTYREMVIFAYGLLVISEMLV